MRPEDTDQIYDFLLDGGIECIFVSLDQETHQLVHQTYIAAHRTVQRALFEQHDKRVKQFILVLKFQIRQQRKDDGNSARCVENVVGVYVELSTHERIE